MCLLNLNISDASGLHLSDDRLTSGIFHVNRDQGKSYFFSGGGIAWPFSYRILLHIYNSNKSLDSVPPEPAACIRWSNVKDR